MNNILQGWDKFTKRITINTGINKVYDAWSTKGGIESWFLRKSVFSRNGNELLPREQIKKEDTYKWLWYGYGDEVAEYGRIVEANGKDMLQFTFTGNCIVTVKIYKEDKEIITELIQENIPEDDDPATNLYVGCGEGWTFYLTNLKSVLEGGLDLRNKNVDRKHVINS
jgi:uncharacterized protein YndB with AHSA1/START domain